MFHVDAIEFVVTKDGVQKVGVDTLKGLNAQLVIQTNQNFQVSEIGFGGGDMSPFEKKQTSVGEIDSAFMMMVKNNI